jgi:integrase
MLRFDMAAARAAGLREPVTAAERERREKSRFLCPVDEVGRVCDFHSLRHSYMSILVRSGASVKVVQELARHSTPTLTIGRYARVRLADVHGALPGPTERHDEAPLRATVA